MVINDKEWRRLNRAVHARDTKCVSAAGHAKLNKLQMCLCFSRIFDEELRATGEPDTRKLLLW